MTSIVVSEVRCAEPECYFVKVKLQDGRVVESIARREKQILSPGMEIKWVTFDSDDFSKEIMLGNIQANEVANAIAEFIKTRDQQA